MRVAGTTSARREGLLATVMVAALLLSAVVVPALLLPIVACAALVNVIRYALKIREGCSSAVVLVMMGANGVVFTTVAFTMLFLLPL